MTLDAFKILLWACQKFIVLFVITDETIAGRDFGRVSSRMALAAELTGPIYCHKAHITILGDVLASRSVTFLTL
ncbi:unnamed protein product, partial [marine sediment metagenome]